MAIVTMAHAAVGAQKVFGSYEPIHLHHMPFVAPLINPNALGGFLAMGVPLLLGLALTDRRPTVRAIALIAAAAAAACVVLTRSRGAIIAMFAGAMLLALLATLRPKAHQTGPGAQALAFTGILTAFAALLGLLVYGWRDAVVTEFRVGGMEKLDLIGAAFRFGFERPWLGIGRGAFGSAFASAHETVSRFDHPENFLAQWSVEWGFPVGIGLVAALVYAIVHRMRAAPSLAGVGAMAGVLTIAAHNLVDLGLELVGVAVVAAALLGAATGSGRHGSFRRSNKRPRLLARGLAVAATLMLLGLAPSVVANDVDTLIARLRTQLDEGDRKGFRETLRRAARTHPQQPEPAILAAAEAMRHDDASAGRWINRGMQLAPGWAEPHLQATRALWNRGHRKQALVELRTAAALDAHAARNVLCLIARGHAQLLVDAAPPKGSGRRPFLEAAASCVEPTSEEAAIIDAELGRVHPSAPAPAIRSARRLLARGATTAALDRAQAVLAANPDLEAAVLLQADALTALSRDEEAARVLAAAAARTPSPKLLEALARSHARTGDAERMRAAFEELRAAVGAKTDPLRGAWMLEGDLERHLGNPGRALRAYEQAYQITGDTTALARVAALATSLGQKATAIRAYAGLCDAGHEKACAERDALIRAAGSPPSQP
jgi:tetratricopeptide (TPR) repeat protein